MLGVVSMVSVTQQKLGEENSGQGCEFISAISTAV